MRFICKNTVKLFPVKTSILPVVAVVGDIESTDVVGIIMHTTWEGSGFHVPLSVPLLTHAELGCEGANPDC